MLNFLRQKKIAKRVLWGLALIIIPAFVLWGAGSISKQNFPYKYIGRIGGKKIHIEDFLKSLEEVRIGLFLNYFHQPDVLDKLTKDRPLLNKLAWENLMMKSSVSEDKVRVTDKEVVDFITQYPLFVRAGTFDERLYGYILRNTLGLTPRAFEESVRNYLINTKYKQDLVKNITVTDKEVLENFKKEHEKANVNYIVIDKDLFKEGAVVSGADIESYYAMNKENYREPEKVVLWYISFPHENMGEKEDAVGRLNEAYEKIRRRSRDMEKIAKDLALPVRETAPFSQYELVPELKATREIGVIAFRMRPMRDVLPVISENDTGTSYIVMVKEKVPPRLKSIDAIRPFITDTLKAAKAVILAREDANKKYEEIAEKGMTLKQAARKYGLDFRESGLITRYEYIEGVGESFNVIEEAFKLGIGDISKPIEVRKGFILIEPTEFQFIDEEKFAEEKEDYKTKFLMMRKTKALEDWLNTIRGNSELFVDLSKI